MYRCAVLLFAEDPGAANYLSDLPARLEGLGVRSRVLAAGPAVQFLSQRGVSVTELPGNPDAGAVLDRFQPRLVAVGTSQNLDTFGLALIDAARARAIVSVGLVDTAVDPELRFCGRSGRPLRHSPDWLVVPDEASVAGFDRLGYTPERIALCGHPAYERVKAAARRLEGENRKALRERFLPDAGDRPVVVFVSEHVDGCAPDRMYHGPEYTLHGRGGRDERTAIVLEELLDAVAPHTPRPYVVLRLHPKNRLDEFEQYRAEIGRLSQGGDALELLWAADLVVGMTSMLLAEAAVLGKPTLAIVPRACERDWAPNTAAGWTRTVWRRGDLETVIHAFLAGPSGVAALMPPLELGRLEGAGDRVAHFLADLVHA